ncbi:MAG: M23 family metallopeptidase [Parcubacteria group bacterium]
MPIYERLRFPIGDGTRLDRTVTLDFEDDWPYGECPTGVDKTHTGIDVDAAVGENVYAAGSGVIKTIHEDSDGYWKWVIVIDHGGYTTQYWYLDDPHSDEIFENATVTKGQFIGKVTNLGGNTHFHFGIRDFPFTTYAIPIAGALPKDECDSYPAFLTEHFINPTLLTYE